MKAAVTILGFCVAALSSLGLVMLYSSCIPETDSRYFLKQLVALAVGGGLCVAAICMDYRLLKKLAWPLFIVAVLLLGLVFVPHLGVKSHGASRWVGYGKVRLFQPSEFAKLALIVVLGWYGERYQRQMPSWKRGLPVPALLVGVVVGLIFKEPDVGNGLLLGFVAGGMLLIAGVRVRYLAPPVLVGLIAVSAFIYHNPMRSERIYSWLHVEETKQDKGRQAYQAMLALGSGGWTGRGLGDSRQKYGFVSEQRTDFIFPIIGEELGLVASLLIVVAFCAILVSGLYISSRAPDAFGLLVGSGVTLLVALQAWINIGVVTSALPNKGLPLPFISYGGSNLVAMLICVGILLSIARLAREREVGQAEPSRDRFRGSRRNPFQRQSPGGAASEPAAFPMET